MNYFYYKDLDDYYIKATAPEEKLKRYNGMMGIFSVIFVAVSLLLTPWLGSTGYIIANIINMICRCIHHLYYLWHYSEKEHVFRQICPSALWLACLTGTSMLLLWSEQQSLPYTMKSLVLHIGIGGICGIAILVLFAVIDKKTVQEGLRLFRKDKKTE